MHTSSLVNQGVKARGYDSEFLHQAGFWRWRLLLFSLLQSPKGFGERFSLLFRLFPSFTSTTLPFHLEQCHWDLGKQTSNFAIRNLEVCMVALVILYLSFPLCNFRPVRLLYLLCWFVYLIKRPLRWEICNGLFSGSASSNNRFWKVKATITGQIHVSTCFWKLMFNRMGNTFV